MKVLHFGLDAPLSNPSRQVTHCPLIRVQMCQSPAINHLPENAKKATHLLFTSKSAVRFFFAIVPKLKPDLHVLSIGQATTKLLTKLGVPVFRTAHDESSEGVIQMLSTIPLDGAHLLWPHSALSRPVIENDLRSLNIPYTTCALYDTYPVRPNPLPDLAAFDEIVFTSPSTVRSFFACYPDIPTHLNVSCIGPITKNALLDITSIRHNAD